MDRWQPSVFGWRSPWSGSEADPITWRYRLWYRLYRSVRVTKHRFGLPMRIGIQGVGLEGRVVLEQPIENIDRFPHPAGNEAAEQGDVGVGDMIITLSEQPSYAKEFTIIQF